MSSKKQNSTEKLLRLMDDAVDDILGLSNADVVEDCVNEVDDIDTLVSNLRDIVETQLDENRRSRLIAAREAIDNKIENPVNPIRKMSRGRMTETLIRAFERQEEGELTMAARGGDGMSDEDMASYLEDLYELGVITEDDL